MGGAELSYASDLDVVFVYDGSTPDDFAAAERVATTLLSSLGGNRPHIYDIDADLRPEGKDGPLARSLDGYREYFERWAQPWERLAMVRARPVAGDRDVARTVHAGARRRSCGAAPFTDDDRREIRRIKARVENERIPANEDPQYHLKLGRGTLSDVEFCAQLLQLDHDVRESGTMAALDALRGAGRDDATRTIDVLAESYRFCERTRNRLFLVNSAPARLPAAAARGPRAARGVARDHCPPAARRLPPRHPPGATGVRTPLLRPRQIR